MSVSIAILDAMLTPTPGNNAETLYQSIPLPNRVRELTSLLNQLCTTTATTTNDNAGTNNNNAGRAMLTAVLLRRDISSLAGNSTMTGLTKDQAVGVMGEVAEPLLSLFASSSSSSFTTAKRQIGHVIAELCGSLSVVSESHGREWMRSVLGRLEHGVSCVPCFIVYHTMVVKSCCDM